MVAQMQIVVRGIVVVMLIDLSIKIESSTPVYPGDPPIQVEPAGTVATDGYALHALRLGTHSGTHIDAPAHMIEGGATLDTLPLTVFKGRGVLIEGFSLAAVQQAGLQANDIAVFVTGTSDRLYAADYYTDYPAMDEAVARYLVEVGVKLVAIDTCSIDNRDGFPIHHIVLGAGIPIVENLVGLTALRGKQFELIALPLRIDADGAPARVIAEAVA